MTTEDVFTSPQPTNNNTSGGAPVDHLDVEIGEHTYQIGRFNARAGSWVLMQILTKMLPSGIESNLNTAGLPIGRAAISEADFHNIQDHCLSVCRRYERGVPMPVFVPQSKTFAIRELEYDLGAVMALTIQALVFNVSPFFSGDGLTQLLQSLPSSR